MGREARMVKAEIGSESTVLSGEGDSIDLGQKKGKRIGGRQEMRCKVVDKLVNDSNTVRGARTGRSF